MFRDLLVHVDGSEGGRRRVRVAADLAKCTNARLSGLHVMPPADVPPGYKPSHVAEVATSLTEKLAVDARAATAIFHDEAPDSCWFEATGDVVEGIGSRARYADLVIVGQYERQGTAHAHPLPIAHSLVMRCGRPVLVVPAAVNRCTFERVAVAWDGSREAVRAVHDALPLLRLSRSVQIVTMVHPSAGDDDIDAESLSMHLTHHGAAVGEKALRIRTTEEHELLRKEIDRGKYDLLVMGGYSHAMWFEFIFGGATQSLLLSSNIPILISH